MDIIKSRLSLLEQKQTVNFASVASSAGKLKSGINSIEITPTTGSVYFRDVTKPVTDSIAFSIPEQTISNINGITFEDGSKITGITTEPSDDNTKALSSLAVKEINDRIDEVDDKIDEVEENKADKDHGHNYLQMRPKWWMGYPLEIKQDINIDGSNFGLWIGNNEQASDDTNNAVLLKFRRYDNYRNYGMLGTDKKADIMWFNDEFLKVETPLQCSKAITGTNLKEDNETRLAAIENGQIGKYKLNDSGRGVVDNTIPVIVNNAIEIPQFLDFHLNGSAGNKDARLQLADYSYMYLIDGNNNQTIPFVAKNIKDDNETRLKAVEEKIKNSTTKEEILDMIYPIGSITFNYKPSIGTWGKIMIIDYFAVENEKVSLYIRRDWSGLDVRVFYLDTANKDHHITLNKNKYLDVRNPLASYNCQFHRMDDNILYGKIGEAPRATWSSPTITIDLNYGSTSKRKMMFSFKLPHLYNDESNGVELNDIYNSYLTIDDDMNGLRMYGTDATYYQRIS